MDGGLHISKPKTKSSDRTIILPNAVVNVLKELKEHTDSEWIFPSPVKECEPIDPQSVYRKMRKVLDRAQCKQIRFHDLRHTFATTALEHGMDIKTLSTIIGHISSATTIDIYSHVTDTMQFQAANNIEHGIGNSEAYKPHETIYDQKFPPRAQNRPKSPNLSRIRERYASPALAVSMRSTTTSMKVDIRPPMRTANERCIQSTPRPVRNVKSYLSR